MGKNVNKYLTTILTTLEISENELATLLEISTDDFNVVRNLDQETSSTKWTSKEQELDHHISSIHSAISQFNRYKMSKEEMILSLQKTCTLKNGKNKNVLELSKSNNYEIRWTILPKLIDSITLAYFTDINIGSRASPLKLLNKHISEKIFNEKVEVKEVWMSEEFGGDYQVPKVQSLKEVFSDGSGEWWEDLENYSGDMNSAWKIINFLSEKGVQVRLSNKAMNGQYWWCYMDDCVAQGSTAMEAICVAALKLVNK